MLFVCGVSSLLQIYVQGLMERSRQDMRRNMSRLKLAGLIALRSTAIGFLSSTAIGFLLGTVIGIFLIFSRGMSISVTGGGLLGIAFVTAFGTVLGAVVGLPLGIVTSTFFYPLVRVNLYRAISTIMAAVIAGSGAAMWGPWYFSSTRMTPMSAVTIGVGSVLASLVAGWAGALAAQDIAQWYEQVSANSFLRTSKLDISPGWIGVALLSVLGYLPIGWLVCGSFDAASCLPSPRLYTSVAAGFKVTLPILFTSVLIYMLMKKLFKRQ